MKLAEALILRKDIQNRLEQMRNRLTMNAKAQEGERPAENPENLLREMDDMIIQLEKLIAQINLTNANTMVEGESLTALLARRDALTEKISLMNSFLNAAGDLVMRGSRNEVKVYSTVPVEKLRKQVDDLSADLRKLDTKIQSVNWTTEL